LRTATSLFPKYDDDSRAPVELFLEVERRNVVSYKFGVKVDR